MTGQISSTFEGVHRRSTFRKDVSLSKMVGLICAGINSYFSGSTGTCQGMLERMLKMESLDFMSIFVFLFFAQGFESFDRSGV